MPDDTIKDATFLDVIGVEPTRVNEKIGFRENGKIDSNDYFKFTIAEESDFNLTLDGLDKDANVELIDSDGKSVLRSGKKPGINKEVIDYDLEAGDYYVRVFPKGRSIATDYTLTMSAAPKGGPAGDPPDKAPGLAISAEDLVNGFTYSDEIGFTENKQRDVKDYFTFSLDEDREINLTLDQLTADANVKLFEIEKNGKTTKLVDLENKGTDSESLFGVLPKGNYAIEVSPQGAAKTKYELKLKSDEVVKDKKLPGLEIGDLVQKGTSFFTIDQIGFGTGTQRNQKDFYTFSVSQDASFYLDLEGMKANANVAVYEYDAESKTLGGFLYDSKAKGNANESISDYLVKGDYAVVVSPQRGAKTEYYLELDTALNSDDIPTLETAEKLGELVDKPTVRSDDVGKLLDGRFRDQSDWYEFTVGEEKNVNITLDSLRANLDVKVYDSEGKEVYKSNNKGQKDETINETLDAGTYYVEVVPFGTAISRYRLSLNAVAPVKPEDIFEVGDITTEKKFVNSDQVGREGSGVRNEADIYNFSVSSNTKISAVLDGMSQDANLELYDSANNLIVKSENTGKSGELLGTTLAPGDYYAKVIPVGNAETDYRLEIKGSEVKSKDETFKVGNLGTKQYKKSEDIGKTQGGAPNSNDYYNFSLDADSNFTLILDTMTADANVRVLDSEGKTVLSSFNTGISPEKINGELAAGDYKVHVFAAGTAKTNYFLSMGAEATIDPVDPEDPEDPEDPIIGSDPNGTLETATDLGQLPDLITQPDTKIGFTENGVRDLNDYYKIGVGAAGDVTIVLDKLKANADLALLDSSGALVYSSAQKGVATEIISAALDAGDYYLKVATVGTAQTSYSLSIF